jgi:diguanylate cyclase (GGDEF)-like protein/PAS domain S-box-containing protein
MFSELSEAMYTNHNRFERYCLDMAGVICVAFDLNLKIVKMNGTGCNLFGAVRDQMIGRDWLSYVQASNRAMIYQNLHEMLLEQTDEIYSSEYIVLTSDAQERLISWRNTLLRNDAGEVIGIFASGLDITEQKSAEKALKESERSKAVFLANLPGMAYRCGFDRSWTMQFVSEGCFELTGYRPEELVQNEAVSFNDIVHPRYRESLWSEWKNAVAQNRKLRYEYEIITASGELKWVYESGQVIHDEAGNVEALEGILLDITAQKNREAEVQYLNDHDPLTNLNNRMFFDRMLIELDYEVSMPLSIMIVDINGVQLINNAFNRLEGDKLIRSVSELIKKCIRHKDLAARIGGDEFGILLPNTTKDEAYQLLNDINTACERYNEQQKSKLYEVSLSIGFATKEFTEENTENIIKVAYDYLINRKLLSRKSSHSSIVSSIMATVYEKSQETEGHARRLVQICRLIGEKLNLSQKELGEIELFAMLHDIGKVTIDDQILNKRGKLTEDEWTVMKKHPVTGYKIAKSSTELESIANYILSHHERWDGNGYPNGLKGEDIPLISRILSVVDSFDAMTEDRVYRKAMTQEYALDEIRRNAGTQFDPEVVDIFIRSYKN